jgi:hypothetical protein
MTGEVIVVEPDSAIIVVTDTLSPTVVEVNTAIPGPPGPRGPAGDANDGGALADHIIDDTPHPKYDDLPSLTLLFENGLV